MSYSFDLVGVAPILDFFEYQQRVEQQPQRSKAYVGSYICTLDAFIEATEMVYQKPDWDWDAVVAQIVKFWVTQEEKVSHWGKTLAMAQESSLVIGRVANVDSLRGEFESLMDA